MHYDRTQDISLDESKPPLNVFPQTEYRNMLGGTCGVIDGAFVFCGEFLVDAANNQIPTATCKAMRPGDSDFSLFPSLPEPSRRGPFYLTEVQGIFWYIGGVTNTGGTYHYKTFKYDPGVGSWSYGHAMPMKMDNVCTELLVEGGTEIFVSPSLTDSYQPFIFDTVTGNWTRLEYNPFNGYKRYSRCSRYTNTDGRDFIVLAGGR